MICLEVRPSIIEIVFEILHFLAQCNAVRTVGWEFLQSRRIRVPDWISIHICVKVDD